MEHKEEEVCSKRMRGEDNVVMKGLSEAVSHSKGILKAEHFEAALKEVKPSVTEEVRIVIFMDINFKILQSKYFNDKF